MRYANVSISCRETTRDGVVTVAPTRNRSASVPCVGTDRSVTAGRDGGDDLMIRPGGCVSVGHGFNDSFSRRPARRYGGAPPMASFLAPRVRPPPGLYRVARLFRRLSFSFLLVMIIFMSRVG